MAVEIPGLLFKTEPTLDLATDGVEYLRALDGTGRSVLLPSEDLALGRQTQSGFWDAYSSPDEAPFIYRMRDRVFLGNAALLPRTRPESSTGTWLVEGSVQLGANWIPRDSQFAVMADYGAIAISGYSRTSEGDALETAGKPRSATIGIAGAAINDVPGKNAWAGYFDIIHVLDGQDTTGFNASQSYGIEISAKNNGLDVVANAYSQPGGVYALWLQGGGDPSYAGVGTAPIAAGIVFVKNQQPSALASGFNVGIVFADDSLTYTGGIAPAIRMAEGHSIEWFAETPSAGLAAQIVSTVGDTGNGVRFTLDDNQMFLADFSGTKIFSATKSTSAVNYPQFNSGATGGSVLFTVGGSDANPDMAIRTKGSGIGRMQEGGSNAARFTWSSTGIGFFKNPIAQKTGWGTATGTATRTTFATTTVTTEQLAERVKALIDDLHATAGYGLLAT